jgi:hypothetical protein
VKKHKKKKIKPVGMHQHIDEKGNVFGKLHPVDTVHKNPKTQRFHDNTIRRA